MRKGLLILAAAAVSFVAPMTASAARVFVGVGPGWCWGPYWGGPYWGGPYYGAYYYHPYGGEVKIDTKVKDAQVYVNGAYAGTTHDNKTMHMRPGSYNIEIREAGHTQFAEKVYVAQGKTIHLHPEL